MTSQQTLCPDCRSSLQRLAYSSLFALILGQSLIGHVRGGEDAADPYDTLTDVLMTRYGPDGKAYARNETSPAIFAWSEFPFDDKTFKKLDAALDACLALPQEEIEAYSDIQRALLQRHLWKVFDTTFNWDWWKGDWYWGGRKVFPKSHMDRRTATQPKLVALMKRLALSKAKVLALPDPLAATVKSGGIATAHDPKDRFKPFLPPDLYAKDSSWICVGEDQHVIPASTHSGKLHLRSMFLQFMRLPGGRTKTLEYMERAKKRVEPIPVGTQFALLEQPFLISDKGEIVLSPMIVSVQLRAMLDVKRRAREARPDATQCVAEFVMQPRELIKGNAVMRALTPTDFRYEAGEPFAAGFSPKDPFAKGDISEGMPGTTRLNGCMSCHGGAGAGSVRTRSFRVTKFFFKETTPEEISQATSTAKQEGTSWKRLSELWQADTAREGAQSPATAERPLENKVSTNRAADGAADPYDTLCDVIMTRYGPDGKAYGKYETGPVILKESKFPFGDKTYRKFVAALDAVAALPQSKIEAYSEIKRALLQRHLWTVFDATIPRKWQRHNDRRTAVQPRIASLIQRLALTKPEIRALPNTLAATVKSGQFAQRHNPQDPFQPFLAGDLYAKESSWICLGEVSNPIAADQHSSKLLWRSTFLQFIRLPGGRTETLKYLKSLKDRAKVFPVGTQFALVEQSFLISDEGEMILSPLIVGIQLRAFLDVKRHFFDTRPKATQCVAEFVMQPRQLIQGNAVMKALKPSDFRFEAGQEEIQDFSPRDPFESGKLPLITRLNLCMNCHGDAGGRSVNTTSGFVKRAPWTTLKEGSPQAISKATSAQKRKDRSWTTLHELWQEKSAKSKPSPAAGERPQPVLDNKVSTNRKINFAADPYDTLYDVIMTRYGPDGKAYAENETSPALFTDSRFPFGDKTYKQFSAALEAFGALPQARIEAYSDVKRALLQRHLWKLFDATVPHRWVNHRTGEPRVAYRPHRDRRAALQPKIASLIRRLALTREQILALPNTHSATVKSGDIAQRYDPKDEFAPFLPADLSAKESSWVCIGTDEAVPADLHVDKVKWRSAFYSFIRLPNGREETLNYFKQKRPRGKFPIGTQLALVEQAFLISDKGELVLSPLVVGISLRAHLNVTLNARKARPAATQCVAEFVMQPRQLIQGNAVMKALDPLEHRFEASEEFICQDTSDPFETGRIPRLTRLNSCMNCHGKASIRTIGGSGSGPIFASSPAAISKATANEKRKHDTWKALRKLWPVAVAPSRSQLSAVVDPPQLSVAKKNKPVEQKTMAAPSSEFDRLYDVLMVRRARNGAVYDENEITPMLFSFSKFPFDDVTYPKLTASLNALTPANIRKLSRVQRAILQRQLWVVFDATVTGRVFEVRSHEARRRAVRKQLADIIRQLALKREEIESLPDTLQASVQAKKYPAAFNLDKPTAPFLPPDITADSSPWVCFGISRDPVNAHAVKSGWRSAFYQFLRVPGGRNATAEYMKRLELLRFPGRRGTSEQLARWNKDVFPVGTQFALVERAFLVSDTGEIVLSPMTVGIQLRAYRNVERGFRAGPATQCVAEFISRPRDYLKGNAILTAVRPTDYRIRVFDVTGGKQDTLELLDDPTASLQPRLQQCMNCHGGVGIGSLGNYARGDMTSFTRRSPKEITEATVNAKHADNSWTLLHTLWQTDSVR